MIDIDIAKLQNRALIQALREPLVRSSESGWNDEDVYFGFLNGLGGQYKVNTYTLDDLKPTQYAGVCTLASLQLSLAEQVRGDELQFFTLLRGTIGFFRANRNELTKMKGDSRTPPRTGRWP